MKNTIDNAHICGHNNRYENSNIFTELMIMHTKENILKVRMDAATLEL